MGVETKTLGMLVDELGTTLIKCYMAQEKIFDESLSQDERFQASLNTHILNARRNKLIRAIDEMMGQVENSHTAKTYDKGSK